MANISCVDNCLVKVADPTFIGYCVEKNADCGAKCVPKLSPDEAAGVICLKNQKFNVIEYSEIDPALAKLTDKNGKLVYNAGIAISLSEHCQPLLHDRVPQEDSQLRVST
jgi:UDP-N-acetylglucosamine pyrophosphorylase